MAKYRHVYTSFWEDAKVMEKFTPEDKFFYLYLLTNPHTRQIGVYKLPIKLMTFELGYSYESVKSLLNRFISHHSLIEYNEETSEIAIKNWGKYNLVNSGKPIMDLINKELELIEDISLLEYVEQSINNSSIRKLIDDFMERKYSKSAELQETRGVDKTYDGTYNGVYHDTYDDASTSRGQKENKNKKENKKIYTEHREETLPVDNVYKNASSENVSNEKIISLFNEICVSLPKVRGRTSRRDKLIKSFWKLVKFNMGAVEEYFKKLERSDFLTGRKGDWKCNFDWVLLQSNYLKVIEGNYDNKANERFPKTCFNDYEQRSYDYDELEKRLLGWK